MSWPFILFLVSFPFEFFCVYDFVQPKHMHPVRLNSMDWFNIHFAEHCKLPDCIDVLHEQEITGMLWLQLASAVALKTMWPHEITEHSSCFLSWCAKVAGLNQTCGRDADLTPLPRTTAAGFISRPRCKPPTLRLRNHGGLSLTCGQLWLESRNHSLRCTCPVHYPEEKMRFMTFSLADRQV